MGASGALLFTDFCPAVDRILALAPQYSVALPFAAFDARFAEFGRSNPEQIFWAFAPAAARPKAHVLFGDRDFADSVHAGMFVLEGFQVRFVKGAGHLVAKQLKKGGAENHLNLLLRALLDFSAPFSGEIIERALGEMAAPRAIDPDFSFAADHKVNAMFRRNGGQAHLLPPPENAVNISKGRRTSQSSLSQWSHGKTTEEDSANAIADDCSRPFAFHTDLESGPWWSIDLDQPRAIAELRIYNRSDNSNCAGRGLNFAIELSDDGQGWRVAFRKTDSVMFGADGKPFIWRPSETPVARHLRICLLDENFLHYQRIEIFGPAAS